MVTTWHKHSIKQDFTEGEYIFHQGDADPGMFVVETGSVAILKELPGKPILTLGYRSQRSCMWFPTRFALGACCLLSLMWRLQKTHLGLSCFKLAHLSLVGRNHAGCK